ncbi:MAG TPA: DUF167 domain-containing protein [Deltaproteobacteria bacterium]|nr:DUF167 domain-containing protein [Deltaproteobacteria bacterium]
MAAVLRDADGGVVVTVRVRPRSSRDSVDGASDGALRVRIAAAPVDGGANRRLVDFIASVLGVRRSQVELAGGPRSRTKRLYVRGLTAGEAARRLGLERGGGSREGGGS